jgi:hypothetical protein
MNPYVKAIVSTELTKALDRPVQNKYVRDKVSTNVIDEDKSDGGRYSATLLVTPEPCDYRQN